MVKTRNVEDAYQTLQKFKMKKKHRTITVDGMQYAWITKPCGESLTTRILKDKKEWISFTTKGITVHPTDVRNIIKKELTK